MIEILGGANMINVVMFLYEHRDEDLTMGDLRDNVGITPRSLDRMETLELDQIIKIDRKGVKKFIRLTEEGLLIAELLHTADYIMVKMWE